LGVSDQTHFTTADAHATGLPAASFDLIIGSDILHHLDLDAAVAELRRLLAPGGDAVFVEPLVHHPLLRIGRRLTPSARTADEHPLTEDDWRLCEAAMARFHHEEREFLTIPLMPLNLVLPLRAQKAVARRIGALDDRLLRSRPGLGKYARRTFLVMGM
jgi:SAM-dependent methyltransferase